MGLHSSLLITSIILVLQAQCFLRDFPFKNVSLPWNVRVDDLVARLTLEEVTQQMANGGLYNHPAPAVPRLGIEPFPWETSCLHGAVENNTTAFPQAIGLAATWSTDIIYRMSEATAEELRGLYNTNVKKQKYNGPGLNCYDPVINIFRDPRWGRNQETYGEDPYMTGMLSTAWVKGLQGDHPRYIRAAAGCKHFDAYGGPDNYPVSRRSFNANVSTRDWRTTFLPAFRYCVEAGTYGIMCSYNSINGTPSCANKELLSGVLRNEWHYNGFVVSDGGAIEYMVVDHKYYTNPIDAVAGAINAGVNLELIATGKYKDFFNSIPEAVKTGKLNESVVRERVKPLFYTRMRLGEFDPPTMNPYTSITTDVIENKVHRDLAVEAAMKSFVLLKNDGTLPLRKTSYNAIAVGPMADNASLLNGDYAAYPNVKFVSTPRQGLQSLAAVTNYVSGCKDVHCSVYDPSAVKAAVTGVDIVFICIGLGIPLETEANDRRDLELPGKQQQLIQDSVQYSGSAQIVLITFNAGPVNITWAEQNPRVSAIIAAFYPGQGTGVALKTVLTSSNHSQFGRLPYTWYYSSDQVPSIVNYTMKGRSYKYFMGTPLYPFGYGLTYTSFEYLEFYLQQSVEAGQAAVGVITVQNNRQCYGDEIIQIYVSWQTPSVETPQLQLVNFTRVSLEAYHVVGFQFFISPQNMAVFTEDKGWIVEEGKITVYAGGQQPGQMKTGNTGVMKAELLITGNKVLGFY